MGRIIYAVRSKVDKDWNKIEFSGSLRKSLLLPFFNLYHFPPSILNTLKDIILEADAVKLPQALGSYCPRPKAAT